MKLSQFMDEEHILVGFKAGTVDEIAHRLVDSVAAALPPGSSEMIFQKIMEREHLNPTILADEVCLLHLRLDSIAQFRVAMAIPEKPVPHPEEPEALIRAFFLILAPQEQNTLMLQTMAAVARLLRSPSFLPALKNARSPLRVLRQIEESGVEVRRTISASDIMEPIKWSTRLDMPLPQAIQILARSPDEGIPVFDDDGSLAGEMTSKEVLMLGMPKYMDLLTNPEMLNAFEPFENYFKSEFNSTVREVCRRDFVTVTPDTPIVSVAHLMITKNRRRIYVQDEETGKILGIIYRKNIVVRVMNA